MPRLPVTYAAAAHEEMVSRVVATIEDFKDDITSADPGWIIDLLRDRLRDGPHRARGHDCLCAGWLHALARPCGLKFAN
jgi:hypothetical protein